LFERVCGEIGVRWRRIPETTVRTADYWIELADGTEVLAEVKQLVPNDEELKHQARFDQNVLLARAERDEPDEGSAESQVAGIATVPGERVRGAIAQAITQLTVAKASGSPAIVVIHNSVFLQDHTDPHQIRAALYGDHVVKFAVDRADPSSRARSLGPSFGRGRKARPDMNTRLSAVAVLQSFMGGEHVSNYLVVYHNRYAAVPVPQGSLRAHGVRQFAILDATEPSEFADWTEVT
jgi:hypothetical protein